MEDNPASHPHQRYILCDAREGPIKVLSQFVVTESLRLVLNDVDATPNAMLQCPGYPPGTLGARCGHRQFGEGDFVAPEQLWPHPDRPFVDQEMPCYSEKADLWRVPEVLGFLLGDKFGSRLPVPYSTIFTGRLKMITTRCKYRDPTARPNITAVIRRFDGLRVLMSQLLSTM